MKNKKSIKSKILVPALAVLALTTTASVTSTVAWFAANSTVSATGMQIKAKSDSKFLLVHDTKNNIAEIRAEGKTSVDFSLNANLYPAALDGNDPTAPNKWYTATGKAYDDGTIKGDKRTFTSADEATGYVIHKNLYFGLAAGSADTGALTVKGSTFTDGIGGATKLILAVGSTIKGTMTVDNKDDAITIDNGLSGDKVVSLGLYFFYDGNNASIKSSNSTHLTSASVALTFTVADKAGD